MKTLTVLCNFALIAFTLFLLVTEGASEQAVYNVFAALLLLVPLLTVFAVSRSGEAPAGALQRITAGGNLVLLGLVVWAIVDQYPHPDEPGVVEFMLLAVLTPLLSAIALLRRGPFAAH